MKELRKSEDIVQLLVTLKDRLESNSKLTKNRNFFVLWIIEQLDNCLYIDKPRKLTRSEDDEYLYQKWEESINKS